MEQTTGRTVDRHRQMEIEAEGAAEMVMNRACDYTELELETGAIEMVDYRVISLDFMHHAHKTLGLIIAKLDKAIYKGGKP